MAHCLANFELWLEVYKEAKKNNEIEINFREVTKN